MGHVDDVSRSVGAWRGLTVGVIALGLALSASAMPRWQKRVLIGKVTPTATEEALVFAPGTGFACKLIDETKPLAAQSSDDPCPEIRVRAYLKSGDTLLPGPTMVGTPIDGVRASWADWGKAAATWGTQADKLLPDANGNVKLGVYTTPMEGGCLPKVAVDAPAADKAGEGCLSIHGTLDVPLRRVGVLAVEAALAKLADEVRNVNENDANFTSCVQDFSGCPGERALLRFAGCADTSTDATCADLRRRLVEQEQARVPEVVAFMSTVQGGPSQHRGWSQLVGILRERPKVLGPTGEAAARKVVGTVAVAQFDAAMAEDDLSGAEDWLETAEVAGGKPAHAARRQKLASKQAAAAAAAAQRAAREKSCVAGCMQAVVACDDNPGVCGGQCNYSSLCPCCNPSKYDCTDGAIRIGYNLSHPSCK